MSRILVLVVLGSVIRTNQNLRVSHLIGLTLDATRHPEVAKDPKMES